MNSIPKKPIQYIHLENNKENIDPATFGSGYANISKNTFQPKKPFGNKLSSNGKEMSQKNKTLHRAGDWICILCNNLNYAFREICNRCNEQSKLNNLKQELINYSNPLSDLNPQIKNQMPAFDSVSQRLPFQPLIQMEETVKEKPMVKDCSENEYDFSLDMIEYLKSNS